MKVNLTTAIASFVVWTMCLLSFSQWRGRESPCRLRLPVAEKVLEQKPTTAKQVPDQGSSIVKQVHHLDQRSLGSETQHHAFEKYTYVDDGGDTQSCFKANSKSQKGEEFQIQQLFFKNVFNGTFIEMGALDGILFSNTLAFERCQKWTGLLLEGNPQNYKSLVKNRPNGIVVKTHAAVCKPPQTTVQFTVGGGPVAGSTTGMSPDYVKRWGSSNGANKGKYVKVPCYPMQQLLHEAHLDTKVIDFWSLDVEGAELISLETVDWKRVEIHVILCELDPFDVKKNQNIRKLLRDLDYVECPWSTSPWNSGLFVLRKSPHTCPLEILCGNKDCETRKNEFDIHGNVK